MKRFYYIAFLLLFFPLTIIAGKATIGFTPSGNLEYDPDLLNSSKIWRKVKPSQPTIGRVLETKGSLHSIKTRLYTSSSSYVLDDHRIKVDSRKRPHTIHALLSAKFENQHCGCIPDLGRSTATLISDHCLVTAKHALLQNGIPAPEITLEFGMQFQSKKFCGFSYESAQALTTVHTTMPIFSVHPTRDIAILTLRKPTREELAAERLYCEKWDSYQARYNQHAGITIEHQGKNFIYDKEDLFTKLAPGNKYGYAAFGAYSDTELSNFDINTTGYPTDVSTFPQKTYWGGNKNMYTMGGRLHDFSRTELMHRLDTSGGQSGAGIWRHLSTGEIELIGVHCAGNELPDQPNFGERFDADAVDFLKKGLRTYDADWAAANLR